jgi:superfamily I DNA/RNA helicase
MAYYFNLPIITQLTKDQQAAVDETESLALSGGPGTGKSVVCLWRHIRNYATDSKISLLLTYTKTLEHYLKQSALSQNQESANNIDRTFWWLSHNTTNYEEIIIDEGQDVSIDKYNRLKTFSDDISYGADDAQSLYEDGCTPEELVNLFPDNEEFTLHKNFRNSKEILLFTRSIFPNIFISQSTIDNSTVTELKPIMKITGWEADEELKQILSIINDFNGDTHNIGILVPGKSKVDSYYESIRGKLDSNIECTKYHSDMPEFIGMSAVHITTFKSSKGTEFDTVIIPYFDSFDFITTREDTKITEKDYYVAFTRTKTNLFLICKRNPNKGAASTFEIE